MNDNCKYVTIVPPAAIIDNDSATTTEVDTLGYDYAEIVLTLGATDIAMTALAVTQSDATGSGHAAITGATFDGGTDIAGGTLALPSATDDDQVCVFQINLEGKKRFLDLTATFGDGTAGGFIAGACRLSRGAVTETTSAGMADGGVCRV
jgi:hypothetical protein